MLKFGTDGVRGRFNETLRVQDILQLGLAYGHMLVDQNKSSARPRVVIGRDSRVSGDALQGAFAAGLMSGGVDVVDLGVLPTPAVAFAVRHICAQGAAMLSASHNPVADNGIKIFNADGKKLSDAQCRELEKLLNQSSELELAQGVSVGRCSVDTTVRDLYRDFLLSNLEGALDGLKIVLDCAHGAAAGHAEAVFEGAGAEVVMLCDVPDGEKINVACGSTDLAQLSQAVIRHEAHLGFAFDGDADRCLAVCETGRPVTGDQMMVVIATELKKKSRLAHDRVVLTVMSNLGAEKSLQAQGIEVSRTPVGDRYVLEEMNRNGAVLGGEQSGHIILGKFATTGDGLLVALEVLFALKKGKKASKFFNVFKKTPQILENVEVKDKNIIDNINCKKAIKLASKTINGKGRLLVRKSGTESLLRILVDQYFRFYIQAIEVLRYENDLHH